MPNLEKLVKVFAVTAVIGLTPLGLAPSAAAAPGTAANTQKLMKDLSNGYGPSTCKAGADLTVNSVAVVDCTQNTLEGGPAGARYIRYRNPVDLGDRFTALIGDDETFPCVPGEPAPQAWHYNATPDATAGNVSCGTFKGTPELIWTNNAKLLMVSAQGSDINAMYQWWLANG
jgi:serine/threonine kinase PknH